MDFILFAGGCAFLVLGFLSFANRDMLWKLYSKERGWRKNNPERTAVWDEKTKRFGIAYIIFGIIVIGISVFAGGV